MSSDLLHDKLVVARDRVQDLSLLLCAQQKRKIGTAVTERLLTEARSNLGFLEGVYARVEEVMAAHGRAKMEGERMPPVEVLQ